MHVVHFRVMENLGSYLSRKGITQSQFADQISTDSSVVSRFVRGLARPGLDLAFKIEAVTDGAVPAEMWVRAEAATEDAKPEGAQA